jgi:hypothetical protein
MRTDRAAQNAKGIIVTSNKNSGRRARILAGAVLLTAGASVSGVLGTTSPANAAPDAYVAVAVGLVNDAPPVTTVGGISIAADQNRAYQGALSNCVSKGGHQCVVEAVKQNGCAPKAGTDSLVQSDSGWPRKLTSPTAAGWPRSART